MRPPRTEEIGEPRRQFVPHAGVSRIVGPVVQLPRVGGSERAADVVQLDPSALRLDVGEVGRADTLPRRDLGIARPLDQDAVTGDLAGRVAGDERRQADPVVHRRGAAREPGDRGGDVDVRDQLVHRRRVDPRRSDRERRADARVVGTALADPAMLPERPAVVRHEDDDGATELAACPHLVDDPPERVVEREQRLGFAAPPAPQLHREPIVDRPEIAHPRGRATDRVDRASRRRRDVDAGEAALIPTGGDPRSVWRAGREVEEVRSVARLRSHEVDRVLAEPIGRVAAGVVAHEQRHALVDQVVALVRRSLVGVALGDPPVPPARDMGAACPRVLVQVLADQRGLVARVVEPGGKGVGFVEVDAVTVAFDAGVVRVPTGQDRRARRAAERRTEERSREPQPPSLGIEDLRLEPGHRRGTRGKAVVRLIVGNDQDHVRRECGGIDRRRWRAARGHQQRGDRNGEGDDGPGPGPRPPLLDVRHSGPGGLGREDHRSSQPPSRACASATTPAAIESAISSGRRPPRSSPSGERIRASCSSPNPEPAELVHVVPDVTPRTHHADEACRRRQGGREVLGHLRRVVIGEEHDITIRHAGSIERPRAASPARSRSVRGSTSTGSKPRLRTWPVSSRATSVADTITARGGSRTGSR